MKKYIISIVSTALCLMSAYADNITVADVSMSPGETQLVSINLTNTETNLVSFQMDLTLPDGITVNKSGCSLSGRFPDDQELTIGRQSNGTIRLTSTSFNLTPIAGTSGEIITLSLTTSADSEGGTATISNIRFVTSNSERITLADATFSISVASASPAITFADPAVKAICVSATTNWDTNGDGELSEAEAAAVTNLGEVFRGNTTITSFNELQYFTGLTSIGNGAFSNCRSLTSIKIPNSVKSIGSGAFRNCSSLTSITIPESVTSIGSSAFSGCYFVNENFISESTNMNNFGATLCDEETSDGLLIKDNSIMKCRPWATSITIPEDIIYFGEYGFRYDIFSVFYDCENLTSIKVKSENKKFDSRNNCNAIIETATNTLLAGCVNTIIPESVTRIDGRAFQNCNGQTPIEIPESVTSVGYGAFNGTCFVEETQDGVTYIGKVACYCESDISSITLREGTQCIADNAFEYKRNLISVTIPNSVKSIGRNAFYDCSNLSTINIGSGVREIGTRAFDGTAWYNNQPDGLVYAGKVAYKYKGTMPSGTQIELEDGTLGIAGEAFYNCEELTSINIPNSVISLGESAFENCRGLTSINIPEGTTSIGLSVFWNCNKLTSVTIPNSVTSIGNSAFWNCKSLTSLTIPIGVADINYCAFQYCSGLDTIVLPNSIKSIDKYAFLYCSGIKDVFCYEHTVPCTNRNAFYESSIGSATLHVPAGSVDAYRNTSPWSNFGTIVSIEVKGDLDGNGTVSITDIVMIIDVMADPITHADKLAAADVNNDGNVTITDCVAAIDLIAAQASAPSSARRKANTMFSDTDFITAAMQENVLNISLENERRYTAFQMTVSVPESMTLGRATMDKMRGADHLVIVRDLGRGQYLVAGFSADNDELTGNSGRLFSIIAEGQADSDILISDVEFATTQAEAYYLADVAVSGTPTGISEMKNEELRVKNEIYDLQGRRITKPQKGIYIYNGKKTIIK